MTAKMMASNVKGIYYREHETRKHGKQKDKYFMIRYSNNGEKKAEAIGWASQGWTLQKANELLCKLKENIRLGKHPQTLAEMREMDKQAQKELEQEKIETEAERITLQEAFDRYLPIHKAETTEATWKNTESYYLNWIASRPLAVNIIIGVSLCSLRREATVIPSISGSMRSNKIHE